MTFEWFARVAGFVVTVALFLLAEALWPRLSAPPGVGRRKLSNFGVLAVGTVLVRLSPVLPFGAAIWAERNGVGLFNVVGVPDLLAFVAAVAMLDLAIYVQHWATHKWRPLWLLHRAHHADLFLDFTTAMRFHPIEIALSQAYQTAVVVALGAGPMAVLVFQVLLSSLPMFNHANLRLPEGLDRVLRLVLVTPDMHRVHHSIEPREANTSYGFNFSWWDRLFGTYLPHAAKGLYGMTIGLSILREERYSRLWGVLAIPFVTRKG